MLSHIFSPLLKKISNLTNFSVGSKTTRKSTRKLLLILFVGSRFHVSHFFRLDHVFPILTIGNEGVTAESLVEEVANVNLRGSETELEIMRGKLAYHKTLALFGKVFL